MISDSLSLQLEKRLGETFGSPLRILHTSPVSGGCINHAHRLETTAGIFFLKFNSSARYPGMFEAEAKGLCLLESAGSIRVPGLILTGKHDAYSFIVLEFLESVKPRDDYWENAGTQLAKLHRKSATEFGLDHDNYIGSLPQSNRKHGDWIRFFIEERLLPLGENLISPYQDKLERIMNDRMPHEVPALLHGDLWSGNILCGPEGTACLIDPAVYYGHREMDLSMTRLFGGFSSEFYEAYESEFPLQPGFNERLDLYNLYPLLVHAKLFSGSYLDQAQQILKRL